MAEAAAQRVPRTTKWIPFAVFWAVLSLVAMSRVFIATHFPHQAALGALIGFYVAQLCLSKAFRKFPDSKSWFLPSMVALLLLGMAFGCYSLLVSSGVNPSASVSLALRHCHKRKWVHLNTTPFFSLFRCAGSLVGIGLARHYKVFGKKPHSTILCLLAGALSVIVAHVLCNTSLNFSSPELFYAASLGRFVLLPIVVALCGRLFAGWSWLVPSAIVCVLLMSDYQYLSFLVSILASQVILVCITTTSALSFLFEFDIRTTLLLSLAHALYLCTTNYWSSRQ